VTNGTIEVREIDSERLIVKIHYLKKGKKREQQIQKDFIVSKELDKKECTFKRNGQDIVEILVDGKALEKAAKQGKKFFLNPYHFVDVSLPTPRYEFATNEKFHDNYNSGYIDVELKTITPFFIQDPKETKTIDVKTEEGKKVEHKEMGFFKVNHEPVIPSTSLKGAFRSIIETVSNSCFPHEYSKNDSLNYLTRRLDLNIKQESIETRRLEPGILKKVDNNWYFIPLDEVKVLTVIDRFDRCRKKEINSDKKLFYAKNMDGEIEKISIKAGIEKYIQKKERRFDNFNGYAVKELAFGKNDISLVRSDSETISIDTNTGINQFNKKFPYIDLEKEHTRVFYGIVRRKKNSKLYKLKEISLDKKDLEIKFKEYADKKKNSDNEGEYKICQLLLKTSFDIDTKTQDRLFFKFGEVDLALYLQQQLTKVDKILLDRKQIDQFKSLLSQRYENLKKLHDKDKMMDIQPTARDLNDGMLVFFSKTDSYLTYTKVARKPYRYGIKEILEKKAVCKKETELCPACNMFGGVNIKPASNFDKNKTISIGGKVSFSFGKCLSNNGFELKTLKPLGEPKPSFYQFYVLNNRKDESGKSKDKADTYDFRDIKLGRKVYLKHNPEHLDYSTENRTKLNSTVELLKTGARFKFRLNYFNLSHYELGLLLYSLDLKYKGKRLHFQSGMGKPLGLGRMEITGIDVKQIDRKQRYSSLKENGESNMSPQDMEKYINIFQRCQVDLNKGIPMTDIKLNDEQITAYQIKEPYGFEDLDYIKEFLLLKSINDGIPLKYPIKYPSKRDKRGDHEDEMKGFKWFMDEKKNVNQRLFAPLMLEKIDNEKVLQNIPLYNWGQVSVKKESRK
jgi:CRISPR-associated protein (TIGR03986 family)